MSDTTLHVYRGEWGLASVDLECLQVLTLMKFLDVPAEINTRGSTFFSPTGFLPYISDGGQKINSYKKISKHFLGKGLDVNKDLKEEDRSLSSAYIQHAKSKLHSYLVYTMWGTTESAEATRFLYAKRSPFPLSFFKPGQYLKLAEKYLQVQCGFSIKSGIPPEEHLTRALIVDAKKFVNEISAQLSDRKWFFGASPSEFDVILYSYLALLLHYPQNFNPLAGHIRECRNLVDFVTRITKTYFEGLTFDSGVKISAASGSQGHKSKAKAPGEEEESNLKLQIIAGLVALVSMIAFSLSVGIVEISRESIPHESMDFDDEDEDEDEGE
ncbi:metaxin-1 homolog [Phlebotomus argentipes]|uniref:metaxin-1 homolog n=1 Tax=Phlebotomus argentipes TaxID=94469 RepID=UPI0028933E71|nr:metaxin-1 homolog [Phlebotomus argentipes]